MNLAGARVLLVADDLATLGRVQSYLAKAGARPQAASRPRGLFAAAIRCEFAVLFDDYGDTDEFDACHATLVESKVPFLIVTERNDVAASTRQAAILPAPAGLVRGTSLLDAIRTRVRPKMPSPVIDSAPELPFTD